MMPPHQNPECSPDMLSIELEKKSLQEKVCRKKFAGKSLKTVEILVCKLSKQSRLYLCMYAEVNS